MSPFRGKAVRNKAEGVCKFRHILVLFVNIEGGYWRVSYVRQWPGESAGCLSTLCAYRLTVQLFGAARVGGGVISVDPRIIAPAIFL